MHALSCTWKTDLTHHNHEVRGSWNFTSHCYASKPHRRVPQPIGFTSLWRHLPPQSQQQKLKLGANEAHRSYNARSIWRYSTSYLAAFTPIQTWAWTSVFVERIPCRRHAGRVLCASCVVRVVRRPQACLRGLVCSPARAASVLILEHTQRETWLSLRSTVTGHLGRVPFRPRDAVDV